MRLLVTGGCGFIGSHFIEEILKRNDVETVVNIDSMTYAANRNLSFEKDPRYIHWQLDISKDRLEKIIDSYSINHIVHFAAESHVDNSINDSAPFIYTNIVGTHKLLEAIKSTRQLIRKFVHVSTDEVYGTLNDKELAFSVDSPYRPNSPYAASKADSDLLVRSYVQTHKLPAVITNCSNNFGPRQFPEKMIPLCIQRLKNNQPIPLYGTGQNIRDWIYVKDHVNALIKVLLEGTSGKQYLIGGNMELTNYDLIHCLKSTYENITNTKVNENWFQYVEDRKGHDLRYAIDTKDFELEFPTFKLTPWNDALDATIRSYL